MSTLTIGYVGNTGIVITRDDGMQIILEKLNDNGDTMKVRTSFEFEGIGSSDLDIDEILAAIAYEISELGAISTPTKRNA